GSFPFAAAQGFGSLREGVTIGLHLTPIPICHPRSYGGYFSRNWPAHALNVRGGEAVHAEGVGDLATVMYVVLDDVPDDPSAGVGVYLAFPLILDRRLQICERIASQHLLHDLPGFFQSAHQLIR